MDNESRDLFISEHEKDIHFKDLLKIYDKAEKGSAWAMEIEIIADSMIFAYKLGRGANKTKNFKAD